MESKYLHTNGIRLHYLDYAGEGPALILMHGLTANAYCFEGLIAAGLSPAMRVISVDLRGRGLSDHPDTGYAMSDHAKDTIGLLDHLGIDRAIVGGHSFGGLLSLYLAAHFPQRVDRMILIDAAAQMHPNTHAMLAPALGRLGLTFNSFTAYLDRAKAAPFLDFWDPVMERYYRADVRDNPDGTVTQRSQLAPMVEAITMALEEPWLDYIGGMPHPAILLNAAGIYTLDAPLLPKENAMATVALMQQCTYLEVSGNHQTMLYGAGAAEITQAILSFLLALDDR